MSSQGDVERNPASILDEEYAAIESELAGVRPPRRVPLEERIDKPLFTAEAGEQRDVNISRLPGLPPALHGEPADNRRSPPAAGGELLQVSGRGEQRIHRRRR
jgi:hypothetical protein